MQLDLLLFDTGRKIRWTGLPCHGFHAWKISENAVEGNLPMAL
jgi:hypothetical protein